MKVISAFDEIARGDGEDGSGGQKRCAVTSWVVNSSSSPFISDGTVNLKVQISVVAVGPINEKDFVSESIFKEIFSDKKLIVLHSFFFFDCLCHVTVFL